MADYDMMDDKEYLDNLLEALTPQQRRIITFKKIANLSRKKAKKCPKSNNPSECMKIYDMKIAKHKKRLEKLSKPILGIIPQTQKYVKKAEGM
jgi:hypothetical protein